MREKKLFVTLSTFTWNNSNEPGADFKHQEVPGWWRWRCTPWKGQAAAETSVCSQFWQKRGGAKAAPEPARGRRGELCQSKRGNISVSESAERHQQSGGAGERVLCSWIHTSCLKLPKFLQSQDACHKFLSSPAWFSFFWPLWKRKASRVEPSLMVE